ncbi:endoplasmic oxidoreductin-1 [Gurleya vavrai]
MIFYFLLISLKSQSISSSIYLINKGIYTELTRILEDSFFSSIVLDLEQPCKIESIKIFCKDKTCVRPSLLDNNQMAPVHTYQAFINQKGSRIDLRKVLPDYTGYKNGAREIWQNIYRISGDLKDLVSGIHFSVTVHKSKNFLKKDGKYLSNYGLYLLRYKREYKDNLFWLYIVVRSAVMKIKMERLKMIRNILKTQGDIKNVRWDLMWKNYEYFFKNSDLYLDCIECGTCKLWGKIQFYGLKTAIDILKGVKISKEDIIILMNFFGKLSDVLNAVESFDQVGKYTENK